MIKADLARIVYETHGGLSQREARELVDRLIGRIKERMARGENVKLSGFGSLNVVRRKSRMGRNPQTGGRIALSASKYVNFRASRTLKF
jgi:integration host factor subunit alpha